MRFLILIPFMLVMLFSSAWEPPTECADEDREIAGNRSTPCKLVLPALERVEYRVEHIDPYCVEKLVFHLPGIDEPDVEIDIKAYVSKYAWTRELIDNATTFATRREFRQNIFGLWVQVSYAIGDDVVDMSSTRAYRLTSSVDQESELDKWRSRGHEYIGLNFGVPGAAGRGYTIYSNFVQRPDVSGKVGLLNSCFDLVRQAQAARDHAAAVKKAEAEAQAQATAQADAANKAAEQARLEAEAQARIAILETKTAVEARKQVQEAELLRTKTLIKDIEHRQELGAILRDIVRIRLAGEEDRARLTNEYLLNVSTTVATFDEEVRAIEAKIQEYVEFNRKLLNQLEAYHAGLIDRLRQANESVVEQQERIGSLEQQIEQLETELESPVPTTTEQ